MSNNINCLFILLITVNFVWGQTKNCPEPYQTWELGTKCFSFLPSRAQWITAQQACRQNDGKLAEIDNAFDAMFISSQAFSAFATYDDSDIWIGLSNLMNTNIYQWADETNLTFTWWDLNQPLTDAPYCVGQEFKNNKSQWKSQNCLEFRFFVCEWIENNSTITPPSSQTNNTNTTTTTTTTVAATTAIKITTLLTSILIPSTTTAEVIPVATTEKEEVITTEIPLITTTTEMEEDTTTSSAPELCYFGFEYNPVDNRCYIVLDPQSITNNDYEGGCKQLGGHLPSIHNYEQNGYIANLTLTAPSTHINSKGYGIPIGHRRIGDTDKWDWTDDSATDYFQWALQNPPPLAKCAIIDNEDENFHWEGVSCDNGAPAYAYICYRDPIIH